jgi:hypothetical protein
MRIIVHTPPEFPEPTPPLCAGETLIVLIPFLTAGAEWFARYDTMTLVERTDEAPFGFTTTLGNWIVRAHDNASVWSSIEWLLHTGVLQRITV